MYHETELNYQDESSKVILNSGTWESAVFAFQHIWEMLSMQFKLNRGNMPTLRPKLRMKYDCLHKNPAVLIINALLFTDFWPIELQV